jgi:hypothetical protein
LVLSQPLGKHLVASVHAEALGNLAPWQVELNGDDVWTTPVATGAIGVSLAASFF